MRFHFIIICLVGYLMQLTRQVIVVMVIDGAVAASTPLGGSTCYLNDDWNKVAVWPRLVRQQFAA